LLEKFADKKEGKNAFPPKNIVINNKLWKQNKLENLFFYVWKQLLTLNNQTSFSQSKQ